MRPLIFLLVFLSGLKPVFASGTDLSQAEKNPAAVTELVLNGSLNESARLIRLAPKLTSLNAVVLDGFSDPVRAQQTISSVAACNTVREITFRNCALPALPANLKMLTQIRSFTSERSSVADGEQFYNAIADMPNVERVSVTGKDFRSLPRSFARMRVMKSISLVNEDMELASGYDRNTRTMDELRAGDTVTFGFGSDVLLLTYHCYNQQACASHLQMFRDVLQGAFRQSNDFYSPSSARAFVKHHPLVKPPVKGLDVYPDVYSLNAMTGSQLEYGSGTRISVPPMAFEDANGSPVTGEVNITYREFRDPVDIVLSGIPMQYDSGGVVGDFRSAGMFEMNASQNGNEVFLREGKKVNLKFAVTDTTAAYNFYRLDDQNGWQYLSNPGSVESDSISVTTPAARQAAVSDFQFAQKEGLDSLLNTTAAVNRYLINIAAITRPRVKDTTSFDRRYADTSYFGEHRSFAGSLRGWKQKQARSSHLFIRKRASGKNYTVVSIEARKGYFQSNPELGAYRGYYWKIDGNIRGGQISKKYGRKSGINDCRILQEGGEYFIELKYYWGFERLRAEPVTLDSENKPKSLSERRQKTLYDHYSRRLNHRRKQMDRGNEREVKRQERKEDRMHNDSIRAWRSAKPCMTAEEEAMTYEEFHAYAKAEKIRMLAPVLNKEVNAGSAVYQALSIEGMGIFNCDQIARIAKPKQILAKTIAVAGAVIVPVIIYVVDKVRNMVFTYSGGGGNGVPATYGEDTRNYLLATDKEGNLYRTTDTQFDQRSAVGPDEFQFEADKISGPATTPQSVREAVFGTSPVN
jgi:hypothetical protein